MMQLLAARIDRSRRILVNARLDGYPAYFYIEPGAIPAALQQPVTSADEAVTLLQANWDRLASALEKQVRRYGNDFIVTANSL